MENIIYLIITALIFLAIRPLVIWYYKIDEQIKNQHETIRLLKKLANESDSPQITDPLHDLETLRKTGRITEQEYQLRLHQLKYK